MAKRKQRVIPGGGVPDAPRLNDKGQEVLDTTPVTLPVRYQRGENITDRVQRMVEETISRRMAQAGLESIDDANDFYVEGDDYFPSSEHEVDDDAERQYFERRDAAQLSERAKRTPLFGNRKDKSEAESPAKPPETADKGDVGDKPKTG